MAFRATARVADALAPRCVPGACLARRAFAVEAAAIPSAPAGIPAAPVGIPAAPLAPVGVPAAPPRPADAASASAGGSVLEQAAARQQRMVSNTAEDQLASNNAVLKSYSGKEANGARTYSWLKQMQKDGIQPDLRSYNYALKAWAQERKSPEISALLEEMVARGITPTTASYTNLVQSLGRNGDIEGMIKAVALMKAKGAPPNAVTYTIMIGAYATAGRIEDATKALAEFELVGGDGSVTETLQQPYCAMMTAYSKARKHEEAEAMWQRMMQKGFTPDLVADTSYIQAKLLAGEPDVAQGHLEKMVSDGKRPNGITFSLVLSTMAARGDGNNYDAAMKIYQAMETLNVRPSDKGYNAMILVCAQAARTYKAEEIMDSMRRGSITEVSVGAVMNSHARFGDIDKCEALMQRMKAHGMMPNRIICNTMVKVFCKRGQMENAMAWVRPEVRAGEILEPTNFTYSPLIAQAARKGEMEQVASFLAEMKTKGLEPTDISLKVIQQAEERIVEAKAARARDEAEQAAQAAQALQQQQAAPAQAFQGAPPKRTAADWVIQQATDGSSMYRNLATGEVTASPQRGIVEMVSEQGKYYWDLETNTTSWEL